MTYELVLRGATLVRPEGRFVADLGIADGKIAAIDPQLGGSFLKELNLDGQVILPGLIDPHVHMRTPGHTHKEDFTSGTLAAASSGITTVLDMPNTSPPTTDRERLAEKRLLAQALSVVDFGLYLGATRDNVAELQAAAETENFAAIKIFMGSSTGALLVSDEAALRHLFQGTRRLITVHAEDEAMLKETAARLKERGGRPPHNEVRPPEAAAKAVALAVALATESVHRLHICHLSTAVELGIVAQAPPGLVTVEASPHHLLLNDAAEQQWGNLVKVNPPLRSEADRQALWRGLYMGRIQLVATDHAPHSLDEKRQDYWQAPSGMPGLDTSLTSLLHAVRMGRLSLEQLVKLMAQGPSDIFGIEGKGRLEVGYDADLVLLSAGAARPLTEADLYSKTGWSPFLGWSLPPKPAGVWLRGRQIVQDGRVITPDHRGKEVRFAREG